MRHSVPFVAFLRLVGLAAVLSLASVAARAEMRLVMAEQAGCAYCERWDQEIAHIYPKTAEGQSAALQRIDIHDPLPDGLTLTRPLIFTPTFVLTVDGIEVGRIEGYPGEDFFWGLLAQLIEQNIVENNGETG